MRTASGKQKSKQGELPVASIVKGGPLDAILELESLTRLRRLRSPASLDASWHEILRLRTQIAKYAGRLGPATQYDGPAAVTQIQGQEKIARQKLTEVAAGASFKECALVG